MLEVNPAATGLDRLVASGHLGAGSSLFFAATGLLAFAGLVGHALLNASRNRRMAAVAGAAFQPDTPPAPGRAVLHGRVDLAQGARRAVRIEVCQEGEEQENSGVWTHTWKETSRRVIVEPFYVVDAAGRRTRVEPRDDVLLVDAMDGKSGGTRQRVLSAEVVSGEQVWASGELVKAPDPEGVASGYRAVPTTLVLRAAPGERMLLSSEPLGARFEVKARFHARSALLLGLVAVITCGVCFGPYLARLVAGATQPAQITRLEPYMYETEDRSEQRYRVRVAIPGEPAGLEDDVPQAMFAGLHVGQSIPVRRVRGAPRLTTLGPAATVDGGLVMVAFLLAWLPAAVLYGYRIRRSLTWYETSLKQKGKGKLADST
jgi:hypothetical protein